MYLKLEYQTKEVIVPYAWQGMILEEFKMSFAKKAGQNTDDTHYINCGKLNEQQQQKIAENIGAVYKAGEVWSGLNDLRLKIIAGIVEGDNTMNNRHTQKKAQVNDIIENKYISDEDKIMKIDKLLRDDRSNLFERNLKSNDPTVQFGESILNVTKSCLESNENQRGYNFR